MYQNKISFSASFYSPSFLQLYLYNFKRYYIFLVTLNKIKFRQKFITQKHTEGRMRVRLFEFGN